MSSDEISIRVEGLGKRYEIYSSPRERLKQFILPPIQRVIAASLGSASDASSVGTSIKLR